MIEELQKVFEILDLSYDENKDRQYQGYMEGILEWNEHVNLTAIKDRDEFIEKPFDLNVVTAKVQAVLRRAYALQGTANIIEHGEMLLNLGDASLTIAGRKIELTKNEFKICQMFFESAGKFVTRDAIMTRLWESDEFIDDNTLTVNVARLRKKLEEAGMHDVIRTKKGIGYMLV